MLSAFTKPNMQRKYMEACQEENVETAMHKKIILKTWNELCPYIACIKPADNLYDVCEQHPKLNFSRGRHQSGHELVTTIIISVSLTRQTIPGKDLLQKVLIHLRTEC